MEPPPKPLPLRQKNHYEVEAKASSKQSNSFKSPPTTFEDDNTNLATSVLITCTKGPYLNTTYLLNYTTPNYRWVFGRLKKMKKSKKSTRFCLELDASISGIHLEVTLQNENNCLSMKVKDLGSSNGTKLNGKTIDKYNLYTVVAGDTLHLGRTTSFTVNRIGTENVLSACPVCLCELNESSEAERTIHVNRCLDGSSSSSSSINRSKEKKELEESSRALAVVLQNDPDALIVNGSGDTKTASADNVNFSSMKRNKISGLQIERCPVCNIDITFKSTELKNKHINRCVDKQMITSSCASSSHKRKKMNIQKKQKKKSLPMTLETILLRASKLDQCIICSMPWLSSKDDSCNSPLDSFSSSSDTTSNTAHLRYCMSIKNKKSNTELFKLIEEREKKSRLSALGWGMSSQDSEDDDVRISSDFVMPTKKRKRTNNSKKKKKKQRNVGSDAKKRETAGIADSSVAATGAPTSPLPKRYQIESTGTPMSTRKNKLKRMIENIDATISKLERYRNALAFNLKRIEGMSNNVNVSEVEDVEDDMEVEMEGTKDTSITATRIRLDDSLLGLLHNSNKSPSKKGNTLWKQASSSQDLNASLVSPIESSLNSVIHLEDEESSDHDEEVTTLSQLVVELESDVSDVSDSDDDSILNQSIGFTSFNTPPRVLKWIQNAPANFLIEFPDTVEQLNMLNEQTDTTLIEDAIKKLSIVPLTPDNHQKEKCRQYMLTIMRKMLQDLSSSNRDNEVQDMIEVGGGGGGGEVDEVEIQDMIEVGEGEEVQEVEGEEVDEVDEADEADEVDEVKDAQKSRRIRHISQNMPCYNEMDDITLKGLMESNGMKPRKRNVMIDRLINIWKISNNNIPLNDHKFESAEHSIDDEEEEQDNEDGDQSLESILFKCIRKNNALYSDILRYKVVECSKVQQIVLSQSNFKNVTKKQIREFLDSQGISNSY
jgi:hypothetical protein